METIKLNLGCGKNYMQGYVNIDSNPEAKADVYLDIKDICKLYGCNSVTHIFISHVIGYFTLHEARIVLKIFFDILRRDGILEIEFPDVLKVAYSLFTANTEIQYIDSIRALYAFDIKQHVKGESYEPYKFGWTSDFMRYELSKIGFVDIKCKSSTTHSRADRDTNIKAVKN